MRRLFNIVFGALAMFAVALLSAFISMRLAIHGREVTVPSLTGLTVADATATTARLGLNLSMQNRFYSTAVPSGRILTQSPAAGSIVRRDSQLRVAESLGGQHVTIPNLVGKPERAASLVLRRLNLELGNLAHLPAATAPPAGQIVAEDDSGAIILAQSPSPNSSGAAGPRVSFLLAATAPTAPGDALVMPSLIGLNIVKATALIASAGLHIASSQDATVTPRPAMPAPTTAKATPTQPAAASATAAAVSHAVAYDAPTAPRPAPWNAVVVSQTPLAGHRIVRGDAIRVAAVVRAASPPSQ